jgi:hypothetical protein
MRKIGASLGLVYLVDHSSNHAKPDAKHYAIGESVGTSTGHQKPEDD